MGSLATLDYIIIVAYLLVSLGAGVLWTRSAGRSVRDFFLSGRSLPWWLAGVSMAATNFSIDTPLAITKYVAQHGVAGVWFFWSNSVSALLAAFLFARLWSRADVVTDAELIERRYSGRPAAALRLFKGLYFGVFVNCYVLGWVLKAVIKVIDGVTDLPVMAVLSVCVAVALIYTLASGLKGVVWTDFIQYGVAAVGSILLAGYALAEVGGIQGLLDGLTGRFGAIEGVISIIPSFGASPGPGGAASLTDGFELSLMPASVFLVYVGVQWWAYKYSDGGGKHIQRMLACKDERHARGATLFFALVNYGLQVWPWILTALCSLVILGPLPDPEMGYPMLMARLLPTGLLGLLVVTMLGAFMSTVDTHLNLGASYVVNDLYRRFLVPRASERHYVVVSRLTMLALMAIGIMVGMSIESIGDAWKFILAFSSGAGLTWILRWFWWRVNAWSEIIAMAVSGVTAIGLQLLAPDLIYSWRVLIVVGVSSAAWLPTTLLARATTDAALDDFVRRVRPGGPGWRPVYRRLGIRPDRFLIEGLIGWLIGLVTLFSLNFAIGGLLLGRHALAGGLGALAALAGLTLVWWMRRTSEEPRPGAATCGASRPAR